MGNTADLAMVQKTIIDTLHKEGKSQRVITERGGCSKSAVFYIYIYAFSRHFYPKRLTMYSRCIAYSGYTFFCQYMCSLGIKPTTFALLTQCSNHWATGTLYQSILNAKLTGRKKLSRKMCTSYRFDRMLEDTVNQSRLKHLGELLKEWTEAGVSASRVTTFKHFQEKGYQATSETETSSEASYLG